MTWKTPPHQGEENDDRAEQDQELGLPLDSRPALEEFEEPVGPPGDGDHYVVDDEHYDEGGDQCEETVPPERREDYSEEYVEEGSHVAQQALGELPVRGIVVNRHGFRLSFPADTTPLTCIE